MFERFVDDARQAIVAAQREAKQLGHDSIGTGHLLLGLLDAGSGDAGALLAAEGIRPDEVRRQVGQAADPSAQTARLHLPFTDRARTVLERALHEALSLGHDHVSAQHLLLGLTTVADGAAADVLQTSGVDSRDLRNRVLGHLDRTTRTGDTATATSTGAEGDEDDLPRRRGGKALAKYAHDLTAAAREGRLDPVIGREAEVDRTVRVLSRRTKNNPVLIGEPGVGKTALAEGLAQRIVDGDVPSDLLDADLYALDIGSMVAGARYRGDFEERMKKVIAELTEHDNAIVFIDEIHTIVGAGAAEGSVDAANLLKPALARGELRTVGATTLDEYRKHFESDAALARRFQPVTVDPPAVDVAEQILVGLAPRYEEHHDVVVTPEALSSAVKLSERYISDRFLPDKAIDLLDEACAQARIDRRDGDEQPVVDVDQIAEVLAGWTGIDVKRLTREQGQRLLDLEAHLHQRVVGQQDAVVAVARAVRRARAGLSDPTRPSGSFLFLGPSGVGKTELAKALSQHLFDSEDSLIRIDMSEYMEKHTVSRLIGSPPGYVGHDEGGQLTEAVRRKPFSVVLLDEVEKAHPDVFNTLLQVLDDGRLTDGRGRVVDFRNTIIIMTSNIASKRIARVADRPVGFVTASNDEADRSERIAEQVKQALSDHFRPEFLNRIDETVVFQPLSVEEVVAVVDLVTARLKSRLAERGVELVIEDSARQWLAERGYDPMLGARPMKRTVQRELEDRVAEQVLRDDLAEGMSIRVHAVAGEIVITTLPAAPTSTAALQG